MARNSKEVQQKAEEKRRNTRTRNWSFVVYPESMPDNWLEILNAERVPWILSPLHDKDIDPTGEPKKAHYHVLILYPGLKSFSQVQKLTDSLCAPIPQQCHSAKGLVRYMAHLDNPEKHQYSIRDITAYNGADIEYYLAPTSSERNMMIREMIQYIAENHIIHYSDFLDYAAFNRPYDWFPLLTSSASYVIQIYIKSNWQRLNNISKSFSDDE